MTARIAHALSELLAPLLGNANLLDEEIPTSHPLRDCVESLAKVTQDLCRFAQRLQAIDVRREPTLEMADVAQVMRNVIPAIAGAVGPGTKVTLVDDARPCMVRLAKSQIEQALLELAHNAREAMPDGGVLDIEIARVSDGALASKLPLGSWVRLRVRDSGCGIEPKLLEHLFTPFGFTKPGGRGAGLGLVMVFAIVRQHGGLLDVESQPGNGTAVSIYLPQVDAAASLAESAPAISGSTRQTPTLLLVEDNEMVRRSIDALLNGMGYRVIAVDSGEQCIERVKSADHPIDLLITDVVMPEMNGRQLIEHVRAMRPDLPVLFMSGYDRSTLATRKMPNPTEHFLQKPFDFEELAEAVRKAMSRPAT